MWIKKRFNKNETYNNMRLIKIKLKDEPKNHKIIDLLTLTLQYSLGNICSNLN